MSLVGSVKPDMVVRDARTYVDYLASLPETSGDAVGTTGYCMGAGSLSSSLATWATGLLLPPPSTAGTSPWPTTRTARTWRPAG